MCHNEKLKTRRLSVRHMHRRSGFSKVGIAMTECWKPWLPGRLPHCQPAAGSRRLIVDIRRRTQGGHHFLNVFHDAE